MSFKIYCVHPIAGLSADEVFDYYEVTKTNLLSFGYQVMHPMLGKNFLRTEKKFKKYDYKNPLITDHAIIGRDHWMVTQADIIYANFLGSKAVSIGSVMELAWAYELNKLTVVVMDRKNIHMHAFVLEAADIIFETTKEAMDYLKIHADINGKLQRTVDKSYYKL